MSVKLSRLSLLLKKSVLLLTLLVGLNTSVYCTQPIDAGIVFSGYLYSSIFWLDNDNLIVPGVAIERMQTDSKGSRLLRYQFSKRSITDMGSFGGALCVSDGYIRFWRPTPDTEDKPLTGQKRLTFAGTVDSIVEVPPPPPLPRGASPPPMDALRGCQYPYEMTNPAWLDAAKESGRVFKPLKPEHGWLEMDRGLPPAYPIAIHPPGKEDRPIPIDRSVLQPWLDQGYHVVFLRYEAFKDAYLLGLDDTRGAGDDKTGKLWWLYSDGRLEEIVTYGREGNWKTIRLNGLIPAKANLLAIGTETSWPFDKSGLYRQTARGDLELLAKGWLASKVLSPDGCKLAFGIDPRGFWVKGGHTFRLQILDVCPPAK